MSVIGDERGLDDPEAVEFEHEERDEYVKPSPWRGTFKRTVRPRGKARPVAARISITGSRVFLYAD